MPAALRKKKPAAKNKNTLRRAKKPARAAKRKVLRKVRAKRKPAKAKKVVRRRAAVTPSRRKPAVAAPARPLAVPAMYGKVTHYYDRIGVAILEVQMPLALGDFVRVRHGEAEFIQPVTSLQIEHQPVARANVGDIVGLRVMKKAPEGAVILPM